MTKASSSKRASPKKRSKLPTLFGRQLGKPAIGEVNASAFFYDWPARRLYIGVDPFCADQPSGDFRIRSNS